MKHSILVLVSCLLVGCSSGFTTDMEVYTLSIEESNIIESIYGNIDNVPIYIDYEINPKYMGYYQNTLDYICLNPKLTEHERMVTLVHEYCHVYQDHVLKRNMLVADSKYFIPSNLDTIISIEQEATLITTVASGNKKAKYLQYMRDFMKIDVDNVF